MAQRSKRGPSVAPAAFALVLLVVFFTREAIVRALVEFSAPFSATSPAARLDKDLADHVDAALAKADIADVNGTIDAALAITDESLSFGLDHKTTLAFSATPREGNCIEYAHLFAYVFNQAARSSGLNATAYVVHSASARVLGVKIPARGFQDHDFAVIEDRTGTALPRCTTRAACRFWYVDPTLHDAWLGWDIHSIVKGTVKTPG